MLFSRRIPHSPSASATPAGASPAAARPVRPAGRGQPVPGLQQPEAERLFGLLDDLQIGGDAAAPVDAVLDHPSITTLSLIS
ncbi:hypothetical protein ADL28_19380 [Streptomyces violaceusniger]|uniref:Uncharacterized protein n=1 Tax=Streptomyces violaceusniger TaxID=68280 RepID=A0A0X3WM76_STRVO|nr:hypothetical protein ADL28_19380 [Streptomyces violaceusniger]